MRIINKKYLLIILLVGIILTGAIMFKPQENVKLDNVILKQEVNSKTFAMYKEDVDNNYVKVEGTKFPESYVLNITESKCIDNNGNKLEGVLSYENDKVVIEGSSTTYCYLYFDKSLGLEIKEQNPEGLKTEKVRGSMYRFQGQQNENVNNYICFGTSDKDLCTTNQDKYMYRIIGIEAETGRVKVIKKKTLKDQTNWADNNQENIEFPDSKIYKSISGDGFLTNKEYVPTGWEEKISNNTWMYGDMFESDYAGARQVGEELYLVETGQKGTIWDEKANEGDEKAISGLYGGKTYYYIRHINEKWTKTFDSKVSLMYLHDYYYALSDEAICNPSENDGKNCKNSWMHLSNNDENLEIFRELTMVRYGWLGDHEMYTCFYIHPEGYTNHWELTSKHYIRPVFYIDSSQRLKDGTGTIVNPFIIKS